jgi:dihydroorotase
MKYLIKNGSIIDPARRVATVGDVLIAGGKVIHVFDLAELSGERPEIDGDVEVINARGAVVAPGFTDLRTHLREPGEEYKETIASGTLAAARGGFTTVCAMPDTDPVVDHAAMVRQIRQIARRESHVHVEVIGTLTTGREGKQLAAMLELAEVGCIAFSDGRTLHDAQLMRNALLYASQLDMPVMVHCDDARLSAGGLMHEGAVSVRLGLPGIPSAAEESVVARDIALAENTGAHLHLCGISTSGSVALIRAAKERGVRVTAEVTPYHLTLTDRWVLGSLGAVDLREAAPRETRKTRRKTRSSQELGLRSWLDPLQLTPYHTSTRVCPPLRGEEDVEALIEGLRDGTIDAIVSAHEPQAQVDKECEYGLATPGISGLETALGLVLTLVHRGEMDIVNMVAKLTEGPAQVLGRSPATLRPGARADVVIFDPDRSWTVDPAHLCSRGKNTPLVGQQLKGQVMLTIAGGEIVFRRDSFGKQHDGHPNPSRLEGILSE